MVVFPTATAVDFPTVVVVVVVVVAVVEGSAAAGSIVVTEAVVVLDEVVVPSLLSSSPDSDIAACRSIDRAYICTPRVNSGDPKACSERAC